MEVQIIESPVFWVFFLCCCLFLFLFFFFVGVCYHIFFLRFNFWFCFSSFLKKIFLFIHLLLFFFVFFFKTSFSILLSLLFCYFIYFFFFICLRMGLISFICLFIFDELSFFMSRLKLNKVYNKKKNMWNFVIVSTCAFALLKIISFLFCNSPLLFHNYLLVLYIFYLYCIIFPFVINKCPFFNVKIFNSYCIMLN
jgi:hypothetical protein